jgi:hypothetical protein
VLAFGQEIVRKIGQASRPALARTLLTIEPRGLAQLAAQLGAEGG